MQELSKKIETILFLKGEPTNEQWLAKVLSVEKDEVIAALGELAGDLSKRGIRLIRKENKAMLSTAPEYSDAAKTIVKEEYDSNLSKAALETLSVIIYKNGASRDEIDYIRGVNSSYILRNLQVRGLAEKIEFGGKIFYKPTILLLRHLGVESAEKLPEYGNHSIKLSEFLNLNLKTEEEIG